MRNLISVPVFTHGSLVAGKVVCFALLLSSSGCSPKLPTVPVTGTVTYNGKPLDGAQVSFVSKEEGGHGASGTTDAQGRFSMQTYLAGQKSVAGAMPGDYGVTVIKREDMSAKMRESTAGGGPPEGDKLLTEEGKPAPTNTGGPPGRGGPPRGGPPPGMRMMVAKSLIPEKYDNPSTSGLTATVKPTANEPFTFELAD